MVRQRRVRRGFPSRPRNRLNGEPLRYRGNARLVASGVGTPAIYFREFYGYQIVYCTDITWVISWLR
ncbi:hypothetical protein LC593_22080 [Nostoc sp. CHAB 5844]|nr:hypothetical protein [Nostoc sp. CHAB 5844]